MRLACLVPLLAAAGCATTPTTPLDAARIAATPGEPGQSCRPIDFGAFVGQRQSAALGQRLLKASGARLIRWVEKDTMVTMEFSGDRLTVALDANRRVERASCG